MRALPYVMVGFMLAPIAIWLTIQFVVLGGPGSLTRFAEDNLLQVTTLGVITIVAMICLPRWMNKTFLNTRS